MMTHRNAQPCAEVSGSRDIVCVEWQGPFFLRLDGSRRQWSEQGPIVYRVDHDGATVYIGCTTMPWPYRLYRHFKRQDSQVGAFLRQTDARHITVSVVVGAGRDLEAALIAADPPRFNQHYSRRMEAAALRAQGRTLREAAKEMGVQAPAVHRLLQAQGLPAKSGHRKISDFDREVMRKLREANVSFSEIGQMFGVTGVAVSQTLRRVAA